MGDGGGGGGVGGGVGGVVAAGVAVWRIIPYCGLAEFYGGTEADTRLGRCVH